MCTEPYNQQDDSTCARQGVSWAQYFVGEGAGWLGGLGVSAWQGMVRTAAQAQVGQRGRRSQGSKCVMFLTQANPLRKMSVGMMAGLLVGRHLQASTW